MKKKMARIYYIFHSLFDPLKRREEGKKSEWPIWPGRFFEEIYQFYCFQFRHEKKRRDPFFSRVKQSQVDAVGEHESQHIATILLTDILRNVI